MFSSDELASMAFGMIAKVAGFVLLCQAVIVGIGFGVWWLFNHVAIH